MEKKNNKIVRCYRQLPTVLKTMVQILAIQVYELRQKDMICCLNSMGYRDEENKPFVQKTLQPLVTELEKQGLLIKKPNGITCPESLRSTAVQDAVMADQFRTISLVVLKSVPLGKSYNGFYFRKIEELYRALQMAVYGGGTHLDIDDVYRSGCGYFSMSFRENHPFLVLFNRPFQSLMFDHIAPEIRLKTLEYILVAAERNLEPVEDALAYCVQLLSKASGQKKNHRVMDGLLLRGEISLHQKLAVKFKDSPSGSAQRGWAQLLCDNNDGALTCFKDALAGIKKDTRKRKVFLPGYEGLFFLFALLKSKSDENYRDALAYIDIAVKERNPCLPVMVAMKTLFQEKLGLVAPVQDFLDYCIEQNHAVLSFLNILVMSWIDKKRAKSHISTLESIRKRASQSGYLWIEAETSALLAELGKRVKINGDRSKNIHQACGTQTLATTVKPIPLWEKHLNSLIHIGEALSQKPKVETDLQGQRLVWILQHSEKYNTCYITPRLQKRTSGLEKPV